MQIQINRKDLLISLVIFNILFFLVARWIDSHYLNTGSALIVYFLPMFYYFWKNRMEDELERLATSIIIGLSTIGSLLLLTMLFVIPTVFSCPQNIIHILLSPFSAFFSGSGPANLIGLLIAAIFMGMICGFFWNVVLPQKKKEDDSKEEAKEK
jgi:hypothetical protein